MKKVLIIQTAFIGDAILATALLEHLNSVSDGYRVDFLVRKGNEALLSGNPNINQVLIWDKKRKFDSMLEVLKTIRSARYDVVLNLQRFLSTGIFTAFSNAKVKVGFAKNPLSILFHFRMPHAIGDGTHEVQRNLKLLEPLVGSLDLKGSELPKPKLYPSDEDWAITQDLKKGVENYITISPSSVWFTKQYPREKWIKFLNNLSEASPKLNTYILGAPSDYEFCESIKRASRNSRIQVVAGKLSLVQSACLMKGAKMNYVNDSAPLHLCSAMDSPVAAIFCSTVPGFGFTPLSTISHVLESNYELDCRPCGLHGKKECPKEHFKCGDINDTKLLQII